MIGNEHLLTFLFIFSLTLLIVSKIDSSINSMEKHWTEGKESGRDAGLYWGGIPHTDSQGAWDLGGSHNHDFPTLKREDLPERTENIYELGQILYVSVRDALPTEENPFPDLEKLEDALFYKDVMMARRGTPGIIAGSYWSMSVYDLGVWNGAGNDGRAFETITGRFAPINDYRAWQHGLHRSIYSGNKQAHSCDSNIDREIREESRPRNDDLHGKDRPDGGETPFYHHGRTRYSSGVRGSLDVSKGVHHGKGSGDHWYALAKGTMGCVTSDPDGWGFNNLRKVSAAANHLHNGGVTGMGKGYDGVERHADHNFIVDARITLMRLTAARDEALKDPKGFMSRLNSIVSGKNENTVDINDLITIAEEPAFHVIAAYKPEYKNDIDTAKRLYNKINTKINILKGNVTRNLKTESNPKPDINDLEAAIDEIKENPRISEYLIQFVADAEVARDELEAEYEDIYRYTGPLKGRIQLALPSDDRPFPDIEPLEDLLEVAFNSADSKRICGDPDQGCRRFLGETFSWNAEVQLQWLKNQEEERAGERLTAAEKAAESLTAYEKINNNIVCVKDPSLEGEEFDEDGDGPTEDDYNVSDELLLELGIEENDKPSGELFDHEACGPNKKARRVASYGRQQLAFSRMMMFNIINMAYEQQAAGIITAGQLNTQKMRALEQGFKGIQGLRGPKGDKGDKGDEGFPGLPGRDGGKGDKGDKGNKGDTGERGVQGIQGVIGATGAAGRDGGKGDKGDKGNKGDPGERGVQGIQGALGAKGDKGEKGTTGDAGKDGTKGEKGERGVQGIQGVIGATGAAGKDGTKGEKGERGVQGIQGALGAKGDKGEKGTEGAAGRDGSKGDKGERGVQGIQGALGAKGDKGEKGTEGASGRDGSKGDKGERGFKGLKGAMGATGLSGKDGDKGDKGNKGDQGLKGMAGIDGERGKRGLRGLRGPSNTKEGETNIVISKEGYLIASTPDDKEIENTRLETSYIKKQRVEPRYSNPLDIIKEEVIFSPNPDNKLGYAY